MAASGAEPLGSRASGPAFAGSWLVVAALALGLVSGCTPQRPPRALPTEPRAVQGLPIPAGALPSRVLHPPPAAAHGSSRAAAPRPMPGADENVAALDAALAGDIDALAQALRTGPVGSRGARLASLRMVAVARALDRSASPDAAREALQRALDLDASDPYACFWMARRDGGRADAARLQQWLACAKRHAATARALGVGPDPSRPGPGAGR